MSFSLHLPYPALLAGALVSALLGVPAASRAGSFAQLSTRVAVGADEEVAIAGLIVAGTGSKRICVRGLGPSLGAAGLTGILGDPMLEVYDASGMLLAQNDDWQQGEAAAAITAFSLSPANRSESALITSVVAGKGYTVVLRGKSGGTGLGLIEIYDLDPSGETGSSLANLSTRGKSGSGDEVMIGGFIIQGENPAPVVLRARGPSLAAEAGIRTPLSDPMMELHDAQGNLLDQNDNWRSSEAAEIQATGLAPADNREPAIARSLAPGSYTFVVKGVRQTQGLTLLEIYYLTPPLNAEAGRSSPTPQTTISVDARGGNDATAQVGNLQRPFATMGAAIAASSAGDTISVRPGVYRFSSQPVTVPNLTIEAEGATFRKAQPESEANLFTVTAPGFTIRGATFDGARGTAVGGAFRRFLLLFLSGADNASVSGCRFINNAGSAIGVSGKVAGATIAANLFRNNFNDLWSESTPGKLVTGLSITDNRFAGNIQSAPYSGAIKIKSTTPYVGGHTIARNEISGPGEMGCEIQGQAEANQIEDNAIDGTVYGISIDSAHRSAVTNNQVKGCTYRGIEFVQAVGCAAEANAIDGTDDFGVVVTREGYGISDGGLGNRQLDLQINGGTVLDCLQTLKVVNQNGVHATNLEMRPRTAYGVSLQSSSNSSLADSTITAPGNTDGPIFIEAPDGGLVKEITFRNVQITTAGHGIYQLFRLWGKTGRINQLLIEGVKTNATFFNSGVINGMELIHPGQLQQNANFPETTNGNTQYGFLPGH